MCPKIRGLHSPALNSCRTNELGNGYNRVQANDDMKLLNDVLGIKWDKGIVKNEDLQKYGKDWYPTFLDYLKTNENA